ncbi:MAG: folate-binding protein, partial [Burkholderiaceae bacterium]
MNKPLPTLGAARLTHLGVIGARGADAAKFLQGQLTNDVVTLGTAKARLAGFCSAKGRLQASFIIASAAADEFTLVCAASVLPATLKRLSMFVLRAQCKLRDATAEAPLWGLVGDTASAQVGDLPVWGRREGAGAVTIRLPDAAGVARCIVIGPSEEQVAAWFPAPLDLWRWLEVQSGVPTIEAATVEQFVPQMLNYEIVGGVDFQKGCYPGQEIVARSQYRGTIKRRMFLFDVDVAASPGQEVFHDADTSQPAGMVVNAAPRPVGAGWSALVEVKLAALDAGTLHLGAPDGASLRLGTLPYTIAADGVQPA